MKNRVCFFELGADDLDAASAFYAAVFDWRVTPTATDDYRFVRSGDADESAFGGIAKQNIPGGNPRLYIEVASIAETVASAEAAGGSVAMAKTPLSGIGYLGLIRDPQGNVIGLFEADAKAK